VGKKGERPTPLEIWRVLEDSQDLAVYEYGYVLERITDQADMEKENDKHLGPKLVQGSGPAQVPLQARQEYMALCRVGFNHSAIVLKKQTYQSQQIFSKCL